MLDPQLRDYFLGGIKLDCVAVEKDVGSWNKHVDLIMHFQRSKDAQFPLSYMK